MSHIDSVAPTSAAVGQTVTITGTGWLGSESGLTVTAYDTDGVTVLTNFPISTSTDTVITAQVPLNWWATQVVGNVLLQVAGLVTGVSDNMVAFTVLPLAPPTVTGVIGTPSGFVSLEPHISFHVVSTGSDPAHWSVDLGNGSPALTGVFSGGAGPFDVVLTGSDVYTGIGVFSPVVTVWAADGSSTEFALGTVTVLEIFVTPGSAAGTETSASGTVVIRQQVDPVAFDPTDYGYQAYELPDTGLYAPTPLVQRRMHRTRAPYAVVDGLAVDPPTLGAMSRSVAYARSWSATANLGDELALGLMGATARWLPDPADITGTGADHWWPHFGGDGSMHFTFSPLGLTFPYVDPDYDYYARNEVQKIVQAMVLDGTSWATFNGPASQPGFSWVVVAVLHHPSNRATYEVLASPSAATDPDRATDATLRYHNGVVSSYGGAKLSSKQLQPPTYKARIRPVILAWAEGGKGGTLGVIDALGRHWQDYAHPNRVDYDLRMKLGMNGGVNDISWAAEMDILDILYWDVRHTRTALGPVITKLDGVYGVTGR